MSPFYSRRHFLRQLLGVGAFATIDPLWAQLAPVPAIGASSFRFAFLTDLHLMVQPELRAAAGIAACLGAVEKLDPRPEFILVGGDVVDRARDLTISEAERRLALFQQIWNDHTALPSHWTFGNHDLVGTSNPAVSPVDPHYGKGLFKDHFHLRNLFYSFNYKGWHFLVLDDISAQPDRTYIGELFDDEIAYLRADLDAHRAMPTIVCTHIPIVSNIALALNMMRPAGAHSNGMKSLVCTNGSSLTSDFPGHNIRAVLAGHLHHYEKIDVHGIPFINSGAVCGSYWKGPMMDCPEGFGVVDLGSDGSFKFDYRAYGWHAATAATAPT
jgi:Icc protein